MQFQNLSKRPLIYPHIIAGFVIIRVISKSISVGKEQMLYTVWFVFYYVITLHSDTVWSCFNSDFCWRKVYTVYVPCLSFHYRFWHDNFAQRCPILNNPAVMNNYQDHVRMSACEGVCVCAMCSVWSMIIIVLCVVLHIVVSNVDKVLQMVVHRNGK